jgi:hypothetical protein
VGCPSLHATRVADAVRRPSPSIDNAGGFFPSLCLFYASSPDFDPPVHGLRPCAVRFLSPCLLPPAFSPGSSSNNQIIKSSNPYRPFCTAGGRGARTSILVLRSRFRSVLSANPSFRSLLPVLIAPALCSRLVPRVLDERLGAYHRDRHPDSISCGPPTSFGRHHCGHAPRRSRSPSVGVAGPAASVGPQRPSAPLDGCPPPAPPHHGWAQHGGWLRRERGFSCCPPPGGRCAPVGGSCTNPSKWTPWVSLRRWPWSVLLCPLLTWVTAPTRRWKGRRLGGHVVVLTAASRPRWTPLVPRGPCSPPPAGRGMGGASTRPPSRPS